MIPLLDLLALQIEALYRCDAQGRLLTVNEPDGQAAPLCFLGRTSEGNLWRCRADMPAEQVAAIEHICQAEPVTADFSEPPAGYQAVLTVLGHATHPRRIWRGPCYVFADRVLYSNNADIVQITPENTYLLERHLASWLPLQDAYAPYFVKVVDGAAVAICASARNTARACEVGLETVEAYRRRGYGPAVASAWAAAIQQSGRITLYSTSWTNHASQHVAQTLGLRLYGEDLSFE